MLYSSSSSDDDEADESEEFEDTFSYDGSSLMRLTMLLPPPSSLKGDTRAPGSWVSIFIALGGVDPVLDAKVSPERAWSKNRTRFLSSEDVGKTLLVVDVDDVTLVEAGNDKLWQDFSSDCNDFSDRQGFSSATGESFGTMFLVLILEWLGVFLVRSGLLIFLFVVALVDVVLFEAPMIERDEPAGCWKK